ncbi:hypothetical protein NE236_11025 [Actinoallomurus purpureus]|uniref:hypothetical protein n=1 Tax=Actinoallomurus purpureus TaxID=478114 RepID=UPI002092B6EC|nr:hypothetical protein [Actinoallomurus purpureus]MCO6005512.1 hypothetical protein [Actinoallomurus purpureus]
MAMQAQDVVSIAAAVLVPIVTATVGALGLMFQDWRVSRSGAGRRKLLLEEATQRVTFTAEWWKARQAIDSTPDELKQAAARALAWLNEASELTTAREEPGVSLGRLLLLQRFERRTAKILRVGYYLSLSLMVLASVAATGTALQGENATKDIVWTYAWAGLFGALALALRFFAVTAEGARPQQSGAISTPPAFSPERPEGQ